MGNKKSKILSYDTENHIDLKKNYGRINIQDDVYYLGNLNNKHKQNGYGTEYYNNDSILYEGEWVNGLKNGLGKMYFQNNSKYIGDFEFDVIHGNGEFYYPNGEFYIGQFKVNNIAGFGKYYNSIGSIVYSGMWLNGTYQGWGIYYDEHKPIFIGHWDQGMANGFGIIIENNEILQCGIYYQGSLEYTKNINIQTKYKLEKEIRSLDTINYDILTEFINTITYIINKDIACKEIKFEPIKEVTINPIKENKLTPIEQQEYYNISIPYILPAVPPPPPPTQNYIMPKPSAPLF